MHLKNVTLEMTLKPFTTNDPADMRAVAHEVFLQWLALVRHADRVSILLWVAEGSDILVYNGSCDQELEWARYLGLPNPIHHGHDPNDPDEISLDRTAHLYRDDAPRRTYGWLRDCIQILREVGTTVTGKPIRIGATFDPGPEFARAPFKLLQHPEVTRSPFDDTPSHFIRCSARLAGDTACYAAFPNGIPDDLPFGTFLGAQCQRYLSDLGYDFVWFSNAFGFGLDTWGGSGVFCVGSIFDGQTFHPERCQAVADGIVESWRLFRRECPDFRIETRGSNLPTSMMLAADAVPVRDLYRDGLNFATPPNSPWAALDGDFGIELVGWMSRIAELPIGEGFPFRFYIHDPWWLGSPWLNQYGREPHDIYLPLAIARLDEAGAAQTPNSVAFLSIEDSLGAMPVCVPNEVIPHMLAGLEHRPDRAGPLVWIYPFDEYHDITFQHPDRIGEVLFGDLFLRGAINDGLPLNTVVSSANATRILQRHPERFHDTVLVCQAGCLQETVVEALLAFVEQGGQAIVYGPLHGTSPRLLDALNLVCDTPLNGDFTLISSLAEDRLATGRQPNRLRHDGTISGGGLETRINDHADPHTTVLVEATQAHQRRLVASIRRPPAWHGGALAFVRGTNSFTLSPSGQFVAHDPDTCLCGERMMRFTLESLGFRIRNDKLAASDRGGILTISRHANAFILSGFSPNTTVRQHLRLPQGAPLLLDCDIVIDAGCAVYAFPRAWHRECRIFIDQTMDGVVCCRNVRSRFKGISKRIHLRGLQDATVRFFFEPGSEDRLQILGNPRRGFLVGDAVDSRRVTDQLGTYLEMDGLKGELVLSW